MARTVESKKSRRGFFQQMQPSAPSEDLHLLRLGRPAMGTRFEILFLQQRREFVETAHQALDKIRKLEAKMTAFDPESELSVLNREAGEMPVKVSQDLFELIRFSRDLSDRTAGAFDITSGALWRCWGFKDRSGEMPADETIREALGRVGSQYLDLETQRHSVRFKRSGIELNLGSIGKGFALDRAAQLLQNAGLGEALLHAGNSSFFAFGSPSSNARGWKVSLRHPTEEGADLATLRVVNMGMATSGAAEQYFEQWGKRFGHIIDPRSGRPVDHQLSATAFASTAALADALSTAFFVMSWQEVRDFCRTHRGVGAIIVPRPPQGEPVKICCAGVADSFIEDHLNTEVES